MSRILSEQVFSAANKTRTLSLLKNQPDLSQNFDKQRKVRSGAVLVPLCCINGQPGILYTKRTMKLSGHRGQVSFPGGMADTEDKDLIETALREAEEELGLRGSEIDVWGTGNPLVNTTSKLATPVFVTPVLAFCPSLTSLDLLNPNKSEVFFPFFRSLLFLTNDHNFVYTRFRVTIDAPSPAYILPSFRGSPAIWGFTAIITHFTLLALCPDQYQHDVPRTR